jgi:uncharacterized membrane protein
MAALGLKTLHVLMATIFLGGGMLIAWFKVRGERSREPRLVAFTLSEVVLADWVFTLPGALLLLASGLAMAVAQGFPILETEWLVAGLADFMIAGMCWLPAVRLQLRMRDLARQAAATGSPLPDEYWRASRQWTLLGVPAFLAALHAVWAMCAKRAWPW